MAVEEITYRARCAALYRSPRTKRSPLIVMRVCRIKMLGHNTS